MRAIDCPCGHRLEGADADEMFRLAREHIDTDHPEMQRTGDSAGPEVDPLARVFGDLGVDHDVGDL